MNEKGFMFPVTLCILLLFSVFLSVQFNQYVIEKKHKIELEQFEKNQYYFLQSLKKVELLLSQEIYEPNGSFMYEGATVTYSVIDLGTNILQISFRLTTDSDLQTTATANFDKESQKISKWVERN